MTFVRNGMCENLSSRPAHHSCSFSRTSHVPFLVAGGPALRVTRLYGSQHKAPWDACHLRIGCTLSEYKSAPKSCHTCPIELLRGPPEPSSLHSLSLVVGPEDSRVHSERIHRGRRMRGNILCITRNSHCVSVPHIAINVDPGSPQFRVTR